MHPSPTSDVINWYFDQSIAYLGIIISLILLILVIKRSNAKSSATSSRYPRTLKFWIHSLYIDQLFLMLCIAAQSIALSLFGPNANQVQICDIISICSNISGSLMHVIIFNLFMERLLISFKGTVFKMSKLYNYIIRGIHFIAWIFIAFCSTILLEYNPYNIYTSSIDLDGNGVTCAALAAGKFGIQTLILIGLAALVIFVSNIFVWSLFTFKLYKVIKYTKTSSSENADKDLIRLMKEQTIIVAFAVSSTFVLFMISSINLLGQFFITLDFVLTPLIIFFCFTFNRYYFEMLKCDKLAVYCCDGFEKRIIKIDGDVANESKAKIMRSLSVSAASSNSVKKEVSIPVSVIKKPPLKLKDEMSFSLIQRDSMKGDTRMEPLETTDIGIVNDI